MTSASAGGSSTISWCSSSRELSVARSCCCVSNLLSLSMGSMMVSCSLCSFRDECCSESAFSLRNAIPSLDRDFFFSVCCFCSVELYDRLPYRMSERRIQFLIFRIDDPSSFSLIHHSDRSASFSFSYCSLSFLSYSLPNFCLSDFFCDLSVSCSLLLSSTF